MGTGAWAGRQAEAHHWRGGAPDTLIPQPSSPQAWDRNAYARNNPLRYTDPSGHSIIDNVIQKIIMMSHTVHLYGGGGSSLGTATSNYTILSHNHFNKPPERIESGSHVILSSITSVKSVGSYFSYGYAYCKQTTIISAYNRLDGVRPAVMASQDEINHINKGDSVDIVHQNEEGQLFVSSFQVLSSDDGFMRVLDPQGIINRGDSGGGVYYSGKLIGNSWFMNPEERTVTIALLSSGIRVQSLLLTLIAHGNRYGKREPSSKPEPLDQWK